MCRSKGSYLSLILMLLFYGQVLNAQVTFVINQLPQDTPEVDDLYISGDFEGWTGGQETYRLKREGQNFMVSLPRMESTIQFKFTRGSWNSVETDKNGKQLENRSYVPGEKNDTIRFSVEQWNDLVPKISTATENVHVLADRFYMPELKKERKVWICLPKGYHHSSRRYPVIYMHDGQNLFDQVLSFSGEWEVDETLNSLSDRKELELIVVGIENAGTERIDEYSPWKIKNYKTKQEGDAYVRFIANTLKPYVDDHYRTLKDSHNTAIMGSSLGGLISHYAVLKYPDTFGKAGIFSPSFELATESFDFSAQHGALKDSKIYLMAGGMESELMAENMIHMYEVLKTAGFEEQNITFKIVKEGEHNETLWRQEFGPAISWLFQNDSSDK